MRLKFGFVLVLLSALVAGCVTAGSSPKGGSSSIGSIFGGESLVVGGVYNTNHSQVGETPPWCSDNSPTRGRTFCIELRSFFKTNELSAMFATERVDKKYPVSYGYPANRFARDGKTGFEFASCGLRAIITVFGLKNPEAMMGRSYDVLTSYDKKIGSVKPSAAGSNWIRFDGFDIDGAKTIVIDYGFEKETENEQRRPMVRVDAENFTPTGPFALGNFWAFDFAHRAFPNPMPGEVGKINVGFIVPMEIERTEPACNRRTAVR